MSRLHEVRKRSSKKEMFNAYIEVATLVVGGAHVADNTWTTVTIAVVCRI